MKEFVFLKEFEAVLPDEIEIIEKNSIDDKGFLVSNSKDIKAEIYAPEINYYLKNSLDDTITKAKNSLILYEARACAFDKALDMDYKKEIGKNIILISNEDENSLIELLKKSDFKVILLMHNEIKFLYGEIGDLFTTVLRENDELEVQSDFILVRDAKDYMLRQSGVLEIKDLLNDEILEYLEKRSPVYKYKSAITYDDKICQYHERRSEHCAKCVDVCPTVAILKDDEKRHLVFSHIDCMECGGCISVCPSGAMDYAKMPADAFFEVASMYEDKKIVIVPRMMDIQDCDVTLPEGFLPFAIEGEKFISQTHLMSLLQISGANLIFYSDFVSPGTKDSINLINDIYRAKFNETAIFVAQDEIELRKYLKEIKYIDGSKFIMSQRNLSKREIFAKRVKFLVGDENLGVAKSGEWVRYGSVEINENSCTLCLSCVGACNVGALVADTSDNSIKFNASICTTCGYCTQSCAEKDTIFLTRGEMRLEPKYFEYQTLAKDKLFKCIECGKEFATEKAIRKIADIMTPKFANDPQKIKTLYCCADCKAKLMIQAQLQLTKKFKEEILSE
ncbi:4Fe-4S dicluster domain-containing protein [Campylobacter sp. FMV-PI01]|uniref:4Fe-4S dicluster domain-containing protein n=1 Tax=Campylobacter portucalensis TaxID=2608384 RepID=A0A6L5WIX9_9BACT|nr:4Fe-4S dicluster domain-containing protein [Campylobacter portucalensis]MSN95955.1 4Fe-4S dicluster domain-containing protein [Campylobacter portucalensis]